MSASFKKITGQRIGILAGGGSVPCAVLQACQASGVEVFIVAFEGFAEPALVQDVPHIWLRLGAAGRVIKALKDHDVQDLVLIGSLHKPGLKDLRPDMKGMAFLARYGYESLGDDGLLRSLRSFLEEEGFAIHGVQSIVPDFLTPEGVLGGVQPDGYEEDIKVGVAAARDLGQRDIGQAVIVCDGKVVVEEGRAGTDAMIESATDMVDGVLVKMCKPQQDRDLDLPTIGVDTVRNAAAAGLAGIVIHAGASLFVQRDEALSLADEAGIFVAGVVDG